MVLSKVGFTTVQRIVLGRFKFFYGDLDDEDPQTVIENYCSMEPLKSKISYARERNIPVEVSVWEDFNANETHVRVCAKLGDEEMLWYKLMWGNV